MHKQQGWLQAWEYCQAKLIQTLGRVYKGWIEARVSASRVTKLRCLQEKGYQANSETETVRSILPWLRRKITELLLSGPKSSFKIHFNLAFHLEINVWSLEEDWRGTEPNMLEVQFKVSTVSDDFGCRDVCWCWSIVFYQVQSQSRDFGALYASLCWQAVWRNWFAFSAGL